MQTFRPSIHIQRCLSRSTRLQRCCRLRLVRWLLSVRAVHTLFFIWDIFVIAWHSDANHVNHSAFREARVGCKSHSQPWFIDGYPCMILEINCHQRGIVGTADEINAAFAFIAPAGLASLSITHCLHLEMPPRLQALQNLIGLEITDSTLVSWPTDATLTDANKQTCAAVLLYRALQHDACT